VKVIGRHLELAGVDRFLDLLAGGPAGLVLEGEPGIGKTTVWRAAIDAARGRSYRVLICRASEPESVLSFLGLGDLLDDIADDDLEALPEPQAKALELALLRTAGERSPDRVSVARGALNVLRRFAADKPTVVAIDDVQWLDTPSADVLRFVAHRLIDERLGFLVAVRTGSRTSLELDRDFPGSGLDRLRLETLSFEELEEVVRLQLPVSFTRSTWRTLHRVSGGNPFFALQLADALEQRGGRLHGNVVPMPETLVDAMHERLAALSPSARAALLPMAALAQPSIGVVEAGAADPEGVAEAVQAGVLQIDDARLRFAHPLLASFVYGHASETERRVVHARLARLVTDPEENALHLGRSTTEADESIAGTLEAAADRAAKRGHPEIAAELAEHAERLTPADRANDWSRRVRRAATFLFTAGEALRSRALLEGLIERLPRSAERARALRLLGWCVEDIPRCTAILEQALDEAGDDLQLRSQLLSLLAAKEGWGGKWRSASHHLREAVELPGRSGGEAALATARARLAWVEVGPAQLPEIEAAIEVERSLPELLPIWESPSFLKGMALLVVDQLDEARARLEESYERGLALGDFFRAVPLGFLAELELRAGNWQQALAHARASEELGRQWDLVDGQAWAAWSRALVEAHLGNVEAAVEAGERASRLARAIGFHWALSRSELALGFLNLSAGDEVAALGNLLPLLEEQAGISLHPSLVARTLSNTIEALVATGELGNAETLTARLEEHARELPVPSVIAAAARCRALVLSERSDYVGARAAIESALSAHSRLREPFEIARTHVVHGSIERRARHKAEARTAFRHAEAIFDSLRARLWLERVRQELARTGLRRSLDRELTPTELRVAELAAHGARNKEIAGALFVSVKTVEANLSRVYAKLGIRSRVELASRLSEAGGRKSHHVSQM
jgi:DNA-binding NarL/FixJ family response regulator